MRSAPGAAAAKTKVILSNETNPPSLKGQTFTYLKQQIEKQLGDKVEVDLHQSGTLFSQKTEVQGLQLGSAHFISPTVGIYSPLAPKLNALLLPFLLSTPKQIDKAMKDPLIRRRSSASSRTRTSSRLRSGSTVRAISAIAETRWFACRLT